jgi:hypothetical protein
LITKTEVFQRLEIVNDFRLWHKIQFIYALLFEKKIVFINLTSTIHDYREHNHEETK